MLPSRFAGKCQEGLTWAGSFLIGASLEANMLSFRLLNLLRRLIVIAPLASAMPGTNTTKQIGNDPAQIEPS